MSKFAKAMVIGAVFFMGAVACNTMSMIGFICAKDIRREEKRLAEEAKEEG